VLARKVPAEQPGALASQIVELAAKTTEPDTLGSLLKAFSLLAGRLKQDQLSALVVKLARMSHRDRMVESKFDPLNTLLPQLSTQQILETLKHPGCVGATRSGMLKHLGQRYKQSFSDVWELVDYLKQHDPDLDLDSPLQTKRVVPRR
jgi:hypothetical protein